MGPSCRPLRIASQPPADAGPHLYPAQQDSARQGSWGSVLQTLVGQPVPLGLRSPRLLCFYYSTGFIVCQEIFLVCLPCFPSVVLSHRTFCGASFCSPRLSPTPLLSGLRAISRAFFKNCSWDRAFRDALQNSLLITCLL